MKVNVDESLQLKKDGNLECDWSFSSLHRCRLAVQLLVVRSRRMLPGASRTLVAWPGVPAAPHLDLQKDGGKQRGVAWRTATLWLKVVWPRNFWSEHDEP